MAPLFRLVSFLFVLFTWVCLATGASVHRRGRCIGVLLSLGYGLSLVFVLVCLSIDVTGALVLPNSFCFARFFLLHAPPFSVLLSFCLTLVLRNMPLYCCVCAVLLLLVCPVLLFLCCPVVLVSSCFLWRRGLVVSVGLVLLAVLVRASVFPVLPALPCCASCLCFSSSPAPRVVSFVLWSSSHSCVLVPPSEYLVAAVTALLPCFLAGSVV